MKYEAGFVCTIDQNNYEDPPTPQPRCMCGRSEESDGVESELLFWRQVCERGLTDFECNDWRKKVLCCMECCMELGSSRRWSDAIHGGGGALMECRGCESRLRASPLRCAYEML